MKRPRKATRPPGALSPQVAAAAFARLQSDYLAILDGSADEDPKRIVGRAAAAGAVLDQIRQLADLAAGGVEAEETMEQVLAKAREEMEDENKT